MMTDYPYEGEVQLLGYAWNPDDGPWIRVRLDEIAEMSGGPHPFNGLKKGRDKGQRMKMRFDLIADDETTTAAETEAPKLKGGPLSKRAGMLCNETAFQQWIYNHARSQGMVFPVDVKPIADNAAYLLRELCQVQSRAEIDHDEVAREEFEQIEREFYDSQRGWSEGASR